MKNKKGNSFLNRLLAPLRSTIRLESRKDKDTKEPRHPLSLRQIIFGVVAEYTHAIWFDKYSNKDTIKSKLFRIFIYHPICYFQNRDWRYSWHWYADYCHRRAQFYSKPDTPFISGTTQFYKWVKENNYLSEEGTVQVWKILDERPFASVECWDKKESRPNQERLSK